MTITHRHVNGQKVVDIGSIEYLGKGTHSVLYLADALKKCAAEASRMTPDRGMRDGITPRHANELWDLSEGVGDAIVTHPQLMPDKPSKPLAPA